MSGLGGQLKLNSGKSRDCVAKGENRKGIGSREVTTDDNDKDNNDILYH